MKDTRAMRKHYPWVFEALERDNYKCVDCKTGKGLIVHHEDESRASGKLNNSLDNLATLCRPCHARRHGFTNDRQDVIEMRAMGMTYQAIGDKLGISRQRVHQLCRFGT